MLRESGDQEAEATTLNNIASAYNGLGDWAKAAEIYETALDIREAQNDFEGQAKTLRNLAIIHVQHSNPVKAKSYLNKAMQLAKKANSRELVGIIRTTISQLPKFRR